MNGLDVISKVRVVNLINGIVPSVDVISGCEHVGIRYPPYSYKAISDDIVPFLDSLSH